MTYPGKENELSKVAKEMNIHNMMDNNDYGKPAKIVARKINVKSTKPGENKLYGSRALMTKESFVEFLIREAEESDNTMLPERVVGELKKLIRQGATDLAQRWKDALELVNKAYSVANVRKPTPDEAGAWKQFESLISFGVNQLAAARGADGDWRMSKVLYSESEEQHEPTIVLEAKDKFPKHRYFVEVPGVPSTEVDAEDMDQIIDKMTNKFRHGGAKVRVEERSANFARLAVYVNDEKKEVIKIKKIS